MNLDQIIFVILLFSIISIIFMITKINQNKWKKDKYEVNLILNKMLKFYSGDKKMYLTIEYIQNLIKGGEVEDISRFHEKLNKEQ